MEAGLTVEWEPGALNTGGIGDAFRFWWPTQITSLACVPRGTDLSIPIGLAFLASRIVLAVSRETGLAAQDFPHRNAGYDSGLDVSAAAPLESHQLTFTQGWRSANKLVEPNIGNGMLA